MESGDLWLVRVGRVHADSGPANILICGPIVSWKAALYPNVAETFSYSGSFRSIDANHIWYSVHVTLCLCLRYQCQQPSG
jgi:hypothetical protein